MKTYVQSFVCDPQTDEITLDPLPLSVTEETFIQGTLVIQRSKIIKEYLPIIKHFTLISKKVCLSLMYRLYKLVNPLQTSSCCDPFSVHYPLRI